MSLKKLSPGMTVEVNGEQFTVTGSIVGDVWYDDERKEFVTVSSAGNPDSVTVTFEKPCFN